MGKQFSEIPPNMQVFIKNQKVFFVGTARSEGKINISPKGMDTFRVINSNKIVWLNLTGSGNETAAHLIENNRMTIMFCAFEGKPLILRLYGKATIYHKNDKAFKSLSTLFPEQVGSRQIIEMDIDLVQTSCGFGVPFLEFKEERTLLSSWYVNKGEEGIKKYWTEKNSKSIDGYDTKINYF